MSSECVSLNEGYLRAANRTDNKLNRFLSKLLHLLEIISIFLLHH